MADAQRLPGVFITFEGGEGAGKTTHINFLAEALRSQGREVLCVREPGGTAIGEALRGIVLDNDNNVMCAQAELLIYEAARAQIVQEVIAPALARRCVVLCDRFCDSTLAYQGYGRGLSLEFIGQVNAFACQGIRPHRTILMRNAGTASVGLSRATHHTGGDRMELAGLDFHERVNNAFRDIAASDPDRVRLVETANHKSDTARRVFGAVADIVGWDADNLPFDEAYFARVNTWKKGKPTLLADASAKGTAV